jgi:hypothetical protein
LAVNSVLNPDSAALLSHREMDSRMTRKMNPEKAASEDDFHCHSNASSNPSVKSITYKNVRIFTDRLLTKFWGGVYKPTH